MSGYWLQLEKTK